MCARPVANQPCSVDSNKTVGTYVPGILDALVHYCPEVPMNRNAIGEAPERTEGPPLLRHK